MDQKALQRAFYGALAVLTLFAFGTGLVKAGGEGAAFALFAVMTLGGGLVCVWERSIVRSAFALMSTFSGVAGFFVLLESDFLAMAQILIYVGGILALILFAVMLTPPDMEERRLPRVLGALVAVGAGVSWIGWQVAQTAEWLVTSRPLDGTADKVAGTFGANADRIGVAFLAPDQYVVAFELAAVLLTVALVAAVYIARRKRTDIESQTGEGVS
jgi:NADH-quinone oxidoreductase subunit J